MLPLSVPSKGLTSHPRKMRGWRWRCTSKLAVTHQENNERAAIQKPKSSNDKRRRANKKMETNECEGWRMDPAQQKDICTFRRASPVQAVEMMEGGDGGPLEERRRINDANQVPGVSTMHQVRLPCPQPRSGRAVGRPSHSSSLPSVNDDCGPRPEARERDTE